MNKMGVLLLFCYFICCFYFYKLTLSICDWW